MSSDLSTTKIDEIFAKKTAEIESFFSKWNFAHQASKTFDISTEAKIKLGEKIEKFIKIDELSAVLIETIRLLCREKSGLESLLNAELCDKILIFGGFSPEIPPKNANVLCEAQKCLVNALFQSEKAKSRFHLNPKNGEQLLFLISELEDSRRKTSDVEWIRSLNSAEADDIWFFYYRLAFITTATNKEFQKKWAEIPEVSTELLRPVEGLLGKTQISKMEFDRAHEGLKTFFNVFCHFKTDCKQIEMPHATKCLRILRDVVCSSDVITPDVVQSAIHCLAVPPLPLLPEILCVDPKNDQKNEQTGENSKLNGEFTSMIFTEALLTDLDKRLTEMVAILDMNPNQTSSEATTVSELLGPYFQTLARFCTESKFARRYCRLRVIPPLTEEEVKKRPEEANSLRGKIVRLMMLPTASKDVASEFLFIICKRSVSRMIKYVGFGHSAGHLANTGLLGQINLPKHDSDSEDSETEGYNSVKDSVNPVTGAMYPADRGSVMAGMSDEQKEHEAMKLVDAMDKLMSAGIVKPGTIGEDGKLREVSHVLELIKDAPEPKNDDSDSD